LLESLGLFPEFPDLAPTVSAHSAHFKGRIQAAATRLRNPLDCGNNS
jgi:hypothetical protein